MCCTPLNLEGCLIVSFCTCKFQCFWKGYANLCKIDHNVKIRWRNKVIQVRGNAERWGRLRENFRENTNRLPYFHWCNLCHYNTRSVCVSCWGGRVWVELCMAVLSSVWLYALLDTQSPGRREIQRESRWVQGRVRDRERQKQKARPSSFCSHTYRKEEQGERVGDG